MSKRRKKPAPVGRTRTAAQHAAARANGAQSHGPVTDDGKARAAQNALRHGLARAIVLSTESDPAFHALHQSYLDEYQPETQTERDLLDELVAAKWQQRRCWAVETALLNVAMERMAGEVAGEFEEIPDAMRTALAFMRQVGESNALALLNRYSARHARDYHRALDKLRAIQASRPSAEPAAHTENDELPNEPGQQLTPAESCPTSTPVEPASVSSGGPVPAQPPVPFLPPAGTRPDPAGIPGLMP